MGAVGSISTPSLTVPGFTLNDAMKLRSLPLSIFSLFATVAAQTNGSQQDPYLMYRPPFARSLPVQIMLTGVVLTLVAVLFIHLMFTAQYHWPLAPVNYVLQLSGVTTLLISLIATIHVVLSATFAESERWPYMLSYIAVNVPPLDLESSSDTWSVAERATWLVMNACTSGLIQITHIQFLTILYPSKLEGRLIFALLGPLAIVAAIMQLIPISGSDKVNRLATDIRNVCNATLSLLFTLALFIWGSLVNRKQAWRTDGGTAVFGAAALSLALISTALNILYVRKEEEFVWLPGLMWAVVLWQSFLGWWWWVGAGSGGVFASEEETMAEKLRREEKKEKRRREARERRKETKLKAQKVWKDVADAFAPSSGVSSSIRSQSEIRSRASIIPIAPGSVHLDHCSQEGSPSSGSHPRSRSAEPRIGKHKGHKHKHGVSLSRESSLTITGSVTGTGTTHTHSTLPRVLPVAVHRWYSSLRHAHNAAARVQAAERVERVREMGLMEDEPEKGPSSAAHGNARRGRDGEGYFSASVFGWGLGWYGPGWRRRRGNTTGGAKPAEKDVESDKESDRSHSRCGSRHRSRSWSRRRDREENNAEIGHETTLRRHTDREDAEKQDDAEDIYTSEAESCSERKSRRHHRRRHEKHDSQAACTKGKGKEHGTGSPCHDRRREPELQTPAALPLPVAAVDPPSSVWWWGPLRRWRLQDSTVY